MANYKIIGTDGQESGLVSPAELRKWAAERRIGPETMTQAEGASEWVPLARVPELAGIFNSTPPPVPAGRSGVPAKTSVMAILSLVFGILGLVLCPFSVAGLTLGIIAMVKIPKSNGALGGSGLALAGTIVSSLALIFSFLLLPALLLPALVAAKAKAETITCVNNEKQLIMAVRIYANQHNNQFPPAATWCDVIDPGSTNVFTCHAAHADSRCDYAFNAKLGGMDESKISPNTVVIFESDGGWDANGGPELLVISPRHKLKYVVALADGSAEVVTQAQLDSLRWDP